MHVEKVLGPVEQCAVCAVGVAGWQLEGKLHLTPSVSVGTDWVAVVSGPEVRGGVAHCPHL